MTEAGRSTILARMGEQADELTVPLGALQRDAAGDWNGAHELVQDDPSRDGAWVHAYLHRKEGDAGNARYWYARAGKSFFDGTLEEEWSFISSSLLDAL